ncbi:M48 family metallopeptidase [Thiomicrolovo sp. ZZH C-3]
MTYSPGLPDEHINLPREHPLKQAFKLSVALALIAAAAAGLLALAVNAAVAFITPEQERVLMQTISDEMNLSARTDTNLDTVTGKLASCVSLPYRVKSYLIEEETPNAFALPGGVIYVSTGLIEEVRSENELAFVLGHELGHFKHKDHLRKFGYGLVLALVAVMVGGDSTAGFNVALDLGNASYSRSAEEEGDLFGLEALQCAYGGVRDATAFFERMATTSQWQGFFASHPDFDVRIAAMKQKIKAEGMNTGNALLPLQLQKADD